MARSAEASADPASRAGRYVHTDAHTHEHTHTHTHTHTHARTHTHTHTGDVITAIDGEPLVITSEGGAPWGLAITSEGGASCLKAAKARLSGPAFSRVQLSVARKGAVQRTGIVMSPRLTGAETDDAVAYRMQAARIPEVPETLNPKL
jgi:hypothetical protein